MKENTKDLNHTKLISGLKEGSPECFKLVYDLYAIRLYSFAYSLTKSKEDSFDIVQEVFERLWTNRQKLSDEKSLESFLFVIGKNLFVSAYRKRLSSQKYEDFTEYLDEQKDNNTAESDMEYDEFKKILNAAINSLPARQRQIVVLSKYKGMKNSEIADTLTLSEQTVKNQLSLGLKTLRESLGKAYILFSIISHLSMH